MPKRFRVRVQHVTRDRIKNKLVGTEQRTLTFSVLAKDIRVAQVKAKQEFRETHGDDLPIRTVSVLDKNTLMLYCQPVSELPKVRTLRTR